MSTEATSAVGALRPHHFAISVPDLAAAVAWYGRMLGFRPEKRVFVEPIDSHVAFLEREGFRIEVFEVAGAQALPPERRIPNQDIRTHGNKHLCFEVSDVAAATAALRTAGVDIALEVRVQGTPVIFVRDCAGNLIEFIELVETGPDAR